MKKIIGIMTIACVLLAMFSMNVSAAADPAILWEFGEGSDIESVMSGAGSVEYYAEGDYHVFTATGNDPYVSINIPADDVSQVLWAKARVKNPGPATAIELFGATNGRSLSGSECTHIDVEINADEWLTYIIYIPDENVKTVNAYKDPQYAITEPYWEGTVEFIRLDPMWQEGDDGSDSGGNMNADDMIYIDYIAFFSSEADAIAFRAEVEPEPEIVEAAVEATAEVAAPATTAPTTTAPTAAPQTSDMSVMAIVFMMISAAAIIVVKKRKA